MGSLSVFEERFEVKPKIDRDDMEYGLYILFHFHEKQFVVDANGSTVKKYLLSIDEAIKKKQDTIEKLNRKIQAKTIFP